MKPWGDKDVPWERLSEDPLDGPLLKAAQTAPAEIRALKPAIREILLQPQRNGGTIAHLRGELSRRGLIEIEPDARLYPGHRQNQQIGGLVVELYHAGELEAVDG